MYNGLMSENTLYDQVLAFYLERFNEGQPMSLMEISRRSLEFFGEPVTSEQILMWSKRNDWNARVRGTLDSPAMKPKKELFEMWERIWSESVLPRDKAEAAGKFASVVDGIPREYRSIIAERIVAVKDEIHAFILEYENDPKRKVTLLGKLTTADLRLDRAVDIIVEIEHDGVNLDMAVMAGRT